MSELTTYPRGVLEQLCYNLLDQTRYANFCASLRPTIVTEENSSPGGQAEEGSEADKESDDGSNEGGAAPRKTSAQVEQKAEQQGEVNPSAERETDWFADSYHEVYISRELPLQIDSELPVDAEASSQPSVPAAGVTAVRAIVAPDPNWARQKQMPAAFATFFAQCVVLGGGAASGPVRDPVIGTASQQLIEDLAQSTSLRESDPYTRSFPDLPNEVYRRGGRRV
ncbi:hypothetical protein B484DRAFT_392625 [Ochromonadaceae sp. CCMP2298]|nr:hypothetical protein B484DRAFT_392625 [Ochromonadaceae sp. CCMP2298]